MVVEPIDSSQAQFDIDTGLALIEITIGEHFAFANAEIVVNIFAVLPCRAGTWREHYLLADLPRPFQAEADTLSLAVARDVMNPFQADVGQTGLPVHSAARPETALAVAHAFKNIRIVVFITA